MGSWWQMVGGWSWLQDPSVASTYLDVFPGSFVRGEKHPQEMPAYFFDILKPISLHVLAH